jgi:threonine dehydrogenase-like Zn-dependent dehydrogenase
MVTAYRTPMRAVTVNFESHAVEVKRVAEPRSPGDDEVLFRVQEVGVCGTDREIAAVRLVLPPAGDSFLTIGHEALGQVVDVGRNVSHLRPGDWVVPLVRRPCVPACQPCSSGRMDLCASGNYVERGIVRMHGYFTDFAVDESRYLLPVPEHLVDVAILIEPLTAVEKSIEVAQRTHIEYFGFDPPRALVLGAGTIGILAALALRDRGFDVAVCSREDRDHARVRVLAQAGIRYLGTEETWPADIVIEAAGAAEALVTGARSLARNGVMVTLGSPNATIAFPFRDLIIKNQALIGSVNATPDSFHQALHDLARFDRRVLQSMIHRVGFSDFEKTLKGPLCAYPKMVHVVA